MLRAVLLAGTLATAPLVDPASSRRLGKLSESEPYRDWRRKQAALLVATVVFIAAAPSIRGGFIDIDDALYVRDTPASEGLSIRSIKFAFTSTGELYWHPLTWLSHALDTQVFGPAPAGHHLMSVVLHALTAGMLSVVLTRLGASVAQSAMGSAFWALHPLRVESFAWVAERKDVLCALFFVAAIAAYLRYAEQPTRSRYAAWLGCGAFALMSKPAAVSLPAVLVLLDYWPRRRTAGISRIILEKLPLAAMAAVVATLTIIGQNRSGATSLAGHPGFATRMACAAVSCIRYLGKILWPLNLACFYPYRQTSPAMVVITSAALLALITIAVVGLRKRAPWLLFCWLWFVVALLPNSGLIQAGRQAMADRFTHIPMMGLTIGMVAAVSDHLRKHGKQQKAAAWMAAAALAALASLGTRQIAVWHDSVTLFEHAIGIEDSEYMRGNLAATLIGQGRYREAEAHLRRAVQIAPDQVEHHSNLALVLLRTRRLDEAETEVSGADRLMPHNAAVAELAGIVALRQGRHTAALARFDRAVSLGFDQATIAAILNDAGARLASRGSIREAEPLVRKAIQFNAGLAQARRNLVLLLWDQGRREDSAAALRDAIQATGLQPEYRELLKQERLIPHSQNQPADQ